uniref:Si:dkey-73n10.1 n=1 Tax=Amphilophus citrinellus TaxID=61819 RepID=A0A3Q0R2M0_AMPCI
MRYKKSPEISSSTAAASVSIRKQKTGGENSSSPSENSVYLAIPRPVYGHNPCCNELGCMLGQRYSVEHGSPRIPNTVYERDWRQTDAHYTERPSIERKGQDTVLQQRVLQFESSADTLKRLTVDAYSPGRGRTLPAVIEPHYSSYPCTPTRTLFGSLSEHSQPLQTSPRGYPGLYPSHPTYEHMTSEVYQERSPMSKYGQLAQHQVFYYPQANVEVENRTQCKDSGSKQREDVAVIHKHTSSNPREHYIVPQSLHAEIPLPLSSTEMLPNHSFMRGFNYPCYAVPSFHLNPNQIRAPLKRQHASPTFHPSHKNVSPSSHRMDHHMASTTNLQKDKLKPPSHHVDHLSISSPFLPADKTSPTRRMSKIAVSPSITEMSRFFPPLTHLHRDPPVFPPVGLNMDRIMDYSSCEAQVPCPKQSKSLPVSPAVWRPQSPSHSSDRIHKDVPRSANVQKSIDSAAIETESKHRDSVSSSETAVNKQSLKRSISHSSPPVKVKEEEKDLYEVECTKKRQKLEMENVREGNKNDSPPMPVIDTVFSLAPYQGYLHTSRVLSGAGVPAKVKSKPGKEKKQDPGEQEPAVCLVSKEICANAPKEKSVAEVCEPKNIKVEKLDQSDINSSVENCISQNNCNKVAIKKEPKETGSCDDGPIFLKQTNESDEFETKPSSAGEKMTSDESKPAELTAQTNSTSHSDTGTVHKQELTLSPKPTTPLPGSKLNFKNIPPQCLKLSTYKIIIPNGKHYFPVPPPQKPTATEFMPKQDLQTPGRKHFFELHQSFCKLVSKSVSTSSEQELKNWLSQLKMTETVSPTTKVQKVSCLLGGKAREVWLNEEMKSALHTVVERLKEYTAQERCPFPHVMRTGAVFLPMLVVKELLFPMVQGSFIDQVLQEHKVKLRPTTLSEEKILIQLHKRACSSRLRRLMSLKHLPDVYADVVNLLHYVCVCKQLGECTFTADIPRQSTMLATLVTL